MNGIESDVVNYRLAPEQSRFTVQAFAEGLLSRFGHNPTFAIRDFTGEVSFKPGTLDAAHVRITVKADSLTVIDDIKESDRQEIERVTREQVLETAKYPDIVFLSINVMSNGTGEGRYNARITGELALHGVTQGNLSISPDVTVSGEVLRAQGELSLRQTDYGIKKVSVAGGMLRAKNEVKLSFDIYANQVTG